MKTALDHFTQLETSAKLALRQTILSVATAVFLASCASVPPTIVQERVGPSPGVAVNEADNGFLTVYSSTEWTTDDDGPSLLGYTNYEIDSADGRLFEEVSNGKFEPTRVILPKGAYTVVAESATSATVRIPVAIEPGKMTVLHLETERDWNKASVGIRSADLVRLPNGQPIGFRARHAELLKDPMVTVAQSKYHSRTLEQ